MCYINLCGLEVFGLETSILTCPTVQLRTYIKSFWLRLQSFSIGAHQHITLPKRSTYSIKLFHNYNVPELYAILYVIYGSMRMRYVFDKNRMRETLFAVHFSFLIDNIHIMTKMFISFLLVCCLQIYRNFMFDKVWSKMWQLIWQVSLHLYACYYCFWINMIDLNSYNNLFE